MTNAYATIGYMITYELAVCSAVRYMSTPITELVNDQETIIWLYCSQRSASLSFLQDDPLKLTSILAKLWQLRPINHERRVDDQGRAPTLLGLRSCTRQKLLGSLDVHALAQDHIYSS